MNTNTEIYETGATSHAVNDLILFTDNTRELAELRDDIYRDWVKCGTFGTSPLHNKFGGLFREAQKQYRKEFPKDSQHVWMMDGAEIAEYCQLYVNDFDTWKKEHGF